jgi:hypothetical protein
MPAQFGGGGVLSLHDVLVASSRLARGDAATMIGVNMHSAVLVNTVRAWRVAVARDRQGDGGRQLWRRPARAGSVSPTSCSRLPPASHPRRT